MRALRDVNEYEMFPGQRKLLKETGQPYEEVGRVKIVDTRNRTAIAQIEYACDGVNPGDTAIPFAEKQAVTFHAPIRFDRFLPASNKLSGRIVMGKDFDSELGTGHKVYLNVGANQGVKIGDYFRAVRSYEADLNDPVDSFSFKAAIAEDTQKKTPSVDPAMFTKDNGPVIHVRDLPRRAVGEIVIIGVTNTTATGMIVFSMEDVHAGDGVELDQVRSRFSRQRCSGPRPGTGNRPRFYFGSLMTDHEGTGASSSGRTKLGSTVVARRLAPRSILRGLVPENFRGECLDRRAILPRIQR